MAEKKIVKRKGIKNVRKTKKRRARNLFEKIALKKAVKTVRAAIAAKAADAAELFKKAVSVIDKAAEKKIIHPNKASRLKSRIALAFSKKK